jgi:hypothetical protein
MDNKEFERLFKPKGIEEAIIDNKKNEIDFEIEFSQLNRKMNELKEEQISFMGVVSACILASVIMGVVYFMIFNAYFSKIVQ